MKKFQNWLREWETYDRRKKHEQGNSQNTMSDCSSSDFTSSSEDESEENLTSKVPNTALLLGPCGIGKTVNRSVRKTLFLRKNLKILIDILVCCLRFSKGDGL